MPYTVLYRKKRPRTFSEMVGQPHIVEALRNQLRGGQTSHAYLFCGTRGTGKTTAAKIMARAINCINLQDGDPCNACPPCESILADRCLDVSEIDAASNNGVDDIRNLREEVKYPPTECTHKVYIVDEVHMLTGPAFNAFLKTLEEPPPHVVFILATTDPQKVPVTVLSRCQRYDYRRIATADIVQTLAKYLREENYLFEPEALDFIAYHCDGAMRDALSLLDQALSLRPGSDAPLTHENVRDLLGATDRQVLFGFTNALAANDGAAVLSIIDTAAKDGRDIGQLAADLIRHLRDALVASLVQSHDSLDVSADVAAQLKTQGAAIGHTRLMKYIRTFSEMQQQLRFAPHKRTALEVCALELTAPSPAVASTPAATSTPAGEGEISNVACVANPRKERADDPQSLLMESLPPPLSANPKSKPSLPQEPSVSPYITKAPEISVAGELAVASKLAVASELAVIEEGSLSNILGSIPGEWKNICRGFAQPLQSWLVRCKVAPQGELLSITSDNEAVNARIKSHEKTIRGALAERYNLATPPNLIFSVGKNDKMPYHLGNVSHNPTDEQLYFSDSNFMPPPDYTDDFPLPPPEEDEIRLPEVYNTQPAVTGTTTATDKTINTNKTTAISNTTTTGEATATNNTITIDDDWAAFGQVETDSDAPWQ